MLAIPAVRKLTALATNQLDFRHTHRITLTTRSPPRRNGRENRTIGPVWDQSQSFIRLLRVAFSEQLDYDLFLGYCALISPVLWWVINRRLVFDL